MHSLSLFAAAGALGVLITSAFFHNEADFSALSSNVGDFGPVLRQVLFVVFWIGVPVATILLVILLAQNDVATDTRHDWLMRPIAPLEIVVAKALILSGAIVAPLTVGNVIYVAITGVSLTEAFALFMLLLTCCTLVLVVSWLVSTPFRAILALAGTFVLLTASNVLAELIKRAVGFAIGAANDPSDPTPFPDLEDSWIRALVDGISVYTVFGVTLWLLLARRKRVTARWLFVGCFAVSTFVQHLLFDPIEKTRTAVASPEASNRR
jgi:hypothetical protein